MNKTPINWFQNWIKIRRWVFLGVCIYTIIYIYFLTQRFSIIQIPKNLHTERFPGGSYILVDWKYKKGRLLEKDDWVIFSESNSLRIGKIHQWNRQGKKYLIEMQIGGKKQYSCQWKEQIKGRVLMMVLSPEEPPRPI